MSTHANYYPEMDASIIAIPSELSVELRFSDTLADVGPASSLSIGLPLHSEAARGEAQAWVRRLEVALDQAVSHSRTIEAAAHDGGVPGWGGAGAEVEAQRG